MGSLQAPRVYNVNVGVLGHVDSGKTSLGKHTLCQRELSHVQTLIQSYSDTHHACSGCTFDHLVNSSLGQTSTEQRKGDYARSRVLIICYASA